MWIRVLLVGRTYWYLYTVLVLYFEVVYINSNTKKYKYVQDVFFVLFVQYISYLLVPGSSYFLVGVFVVLSHPVR